MTPFKRASLKRLANDGQFSRLKLGNQRLNLRFYEGFDKGGGLAESGFGLGFLYKSWGLEMADVILVVEDEVDIRELLEYNLKQEGFVPVGIERGDEVWDAVRRHKPALVLLDLMIPGVSGVDVCRELRSQESTRELPIIMITAKGSETDKVEGFGVGADDYVAKPFSPKELMARIRAVLRRTKGGEDAGGEILRQGDIRIDVTSHRAFSGRNELGLTLTEFKLLKELVSNAGKVLSRNDLMNLVMGNDVIVIDRTIDVHMASLRKKLGRRSDMIQTVRGVGYRLKD
jgi:two-component system phosphate regulon response regulator PhoB